MKNLKELILEILYNLLSLTAEVIMYASTIFCVVLLIINCFCIIREDAKYKEGWLIISFILAILSATVFAVLELWDLVA